MTSAVAKIAMVSDSTQPSGIHNVGSTAARPAAIRPARFPPMRLPANPTTPTVAAPRMHDHT